MSDVVDINNVSGNEIAENPDYNEGSGDDAPMEQTLGEIFGDEPAEESPTPEAPEKEPTKEEAPKEEAPEDFRLDIEGVGEVGPEEIQKYYDAYQQIESMKEDAANLEAAKAEFQSKMAELDQREQQVQYGAKMEELLQYPGIAAAFRNILEQAQQGKFDAGSPAAQIQAEFRSFMASSSGQSDLDARLQKFEEWERGQVSAQLENQVDGVYAEYAEKYGEKVVDDAFREEVSGLIEKLYGENRDAFGIPQLHGVISQVLLSRVGTSNKEVVDAIKTATKRPGVRIIRTGSSRAAKETPEAPESQNLSDLVLAAFNRAEEG